VHLVRSWYSGVVAESAIVEGTRWIRSLHTNWPRLKKANSGLAQKSKPPSKAAASGGSCCFGKTALWTCATTSRPATDTEDLFATDKAPQMNRLQSSFLPSQAQMKPDASTGASDDLPLKVARVRALHHIHDAAEIISDAMPHVAELDRQLYASIVGGLCVLERHLTELNRS
jgi:hypothetical protein